MRRAVLVGAALAALAGAGPACGGSALVASREGAFEQGLAALGEGDPALALRAVHRYLRGATRDDPRYDRALRLMAMAAERLGLRYAASVWYLGIAQGGRDPELLPLAIEGLERIVTGGPHDEELIVSGYLAATDTGVLPKALAAFVDFHAGLDSLRRQDRAWALERLGRIPRASPYAWRARYVLAVERVAGGELAEAQAELEAMLAEADDPNRVGVAELPLDVRNDVERSLARLHFEAGRWDHALQRYDALRARAPSDATLLLEMAWTSFYRGDTRRALGLLVALDAPQFQGVIVPERYLLEAMCLRRLCQFEPARAAVGRLEARYAEAYAELASGLPLSEGPALGRAAERHATVRATSSLRASLEAERARIARMQELEPELVKELDDTYRRGVEEIGRRERALLRGALEAVADQLLAAREAVSLVSHELAVALLRGRRRPEGPRERDAASLSATSGRVIFRFDGEFWTDELDDLLVLVEDRCIE
ncbi:MAG: hypothetical protein IT385_01230 [Deltaproteobacteria bacterium]|nr:hypothetical protein [Deltaproteobacteria bacterium]